MAKKPNTRDDIERNDPPEIKPAKEVHDADWFKLSGDGDEAWVKSDVVMDRIA